MGSDLIAASYSNDVQVGSSAEPAPAETIIHHSEYIVPNELHGTSLWLLLPSQRLALLMPAPRLLKVGVVVNLMALLIALNLSMALLMPAASRSILCLSMIVCSTHGVVLRSTLLRLMLLATLSVRSWVLATVLRMDRSLGGIE